MAQPLSFKVKLSSMLLLLFDLQVFFIFVDVIEAEHVRMLDELHDRDLPLDLRQHGLRQLLFVDDLDRNLLALDNVSPDLDQPCKWKMHITPFEGRYPR